MPSDSHQSRQELEELWRERVYAARLTYGQASVRLRDALGDQAAWPLPAPDGSVSLRQALLEEAAARTEYTRVLKIFNDLIVYGTIPAIEATS
jgi:hypothetical protein